AHGRAVLGPRRDDAGGAGRVAGAHAGRPPEDGAVRHSPHRRGRPAGRPGRRLLAGARPDPGRRAGAGAPTAGARGPAGPAVRGHGRPQPPPALPPGRGGGPGGLMGRLARILLRLATPLASIVALWYLAILLSGLPAFVIPRPERVLQTLVADRSFITVHL